MVGAAGVVIIHALKQVAAEKSILQPCTHSPFFSDNLIAKVSLIVKAFSGYSSRLIELCKQILPPFSSSDMVVLYKQQKN